MKNTDHPKFLWLAAGGTGGHISPAVAIAREFADQPRKKSSPPIEPVLITLPRNLEYSDIKALSAGKIKVFPCDAPRIPKTPHEFLLFPLRLFKSFLKLKELAKTHPPAAVLAFGGYPSFPALLYAWLKKKTYCLHEQNRVEGMVTRWMKKGSTRLYTSFSGIEGQNVRFLGNPLRSIFGPSPRPLKTKEVKTIFFLGGSQGAFDINNLFIEMAADPRFKKINFIISTGVKDYERVKKQARKKDQVDSFIKDMPSVLKKSDLVIARAGSGTLYEILWAKTPSFLIPYPYAKDNHQRKNADALEHEGLALLYDKRPFDAHEALEAVHTAIEHGTFNVIQKQLLKHNFPIDATARIALDLQEMLSQSPAASSEK